MGIIPEGVTVKDIERELAILGQPKTRKGEKKEAMFFLFSEFVFSMWNFTSIFKV